MIARRQPRKRLGVSLDAFTRSSKLFERLFVKFRRIARIFFDSRSHLFSKRDLLAIEMSNDQTKHRHQSPWTIICEQLCHRSNLLSFHFFTAFLFMPEHRSRTENACCLERHRDKCRTEKLKKR